MAQAIGPYSTATEMLGALRARKISSLELVDLHLQRINERDGALNAIPVRTADRARDAARVADAAIARGQRAALLGLPMTLKESTQTAGLPQTAGMLPFKDHKPAVDGTLAKAVFEAGACLLGKTNIPVALGDWQADSPIYGRTNNPWDLRRTPGGSTGGGGAALAAGMTPLEIGSDIGGSIRVPSAYCGVYGHRPSETAIPREGSFPMGDLPNVAGLMGVQGPLARSATDLELLFDVIAGPCIGEDAGWRLALPESRGAQLEDFRVAVMPPMPWVKAASEMHGKVDELAHFLSQRGAKVAQAMPNFDFEQYFRDYLCLLTVTTSQGQTRAEREAAAALFLRGSSSVNRGTTLMASKLSTVSDTDLEDLLTGTIGAEARDSVLSAQAEGFVIDAAGYLALVRRREIARAAWRSFFEDWDVLIGPMTLDAAFEHKTGPFSERTLEIDNETVPYVINLVYPMWAIFAGQPSTAFPAGLNRAGLPLGLQAIGPYLEDRTTLRFAQLLEREWQGFMPPPGY